ncbi:Protein of unknown function [Pyronema omphalodes CBS 100304]|uniref:Uncharacterized protein n=1 Tax=Pyronema omphalodes (strain CBS 100304) TaxID=1076935 RepID=U4L310_PYROM|nr:Protein of unknown function [Pyronema omphalodes CBS 100304]
MLLPFRDPATLPRPSVSNSRVKSNSLHSPTPSLTLPNLRACFEQLRPPSTTSYHFSTLFHSLLHHLKLSHIFPHLPTPCCTLAQDNGTHSTEGTSTRTVTYKHAHNYSYTMGSNTNQRKRKPE